MPMPAALLLPLLLLPSVSQAGDPSDETLEELKSHILDADADFDMDPDAGHPLDPDVSVTDGLSTAKESGPGGGSTTGSDATPYDFVHMDQDAQGASYAAGRDGGGNGVLVKFHDTGAVAWTASFSSPGSQVLVQDVSVSDAGDVYIVTTTYSPTEAAPTATFNRFYKLSSSGFIQYTATWNLNMSSGLSQCRRIQVREATAQVAIYCDHVNTYDGVWVYPMVPGTALWGQIPYNNTGLPVVDLQESLDGTLWILHDQYSAVTGWDMKLVSFTPATWLSWSTATLGTSGSDQRGWGLVSDAHGVLHVSGTTNATGSTALFHEQIVRSTTGAWVHAERER